ncbi:MAG TPA: sulfite exporter TauE/SafE family protein [Gammaproteobacteria bacterium]|nr:sulfite exporter TauE/SafE family protein [Gammaproteobacteria bacterium]
MSADYSYLAALVVGLLGGGHCAFMCGGIVTALTLGLPDSARGRAAATWPYLIAYNLGRITSYTMAGALMGGIGWLAANAVSVRHAQSILEAIAGGFMVALGLYLGGWWQGVVRLEQVGSLVWRRLEPFGRRLLPVRSPIHALLLGLIWGWLPCGLVYSVLIWAIAAGSVGQGAALMLSFGLGTLPALLAMGVFAAALSGFLRRARVRQVAGALVAVFGLLMVVRALV